MDWERGRITVRSPKTERHAGRESRVIPIFPERDTQTSRYALVLDNCGPSEYPGQDSNDVVDSSRKSTRAVGAGALSVHSAGELALDEAVELLDSVSTQALLDALARRLAGQPGGSPR